MKKLAVFLPLVLCLVQSFAQDSTSKWQLSAGLVIDQVAVTSISGTDTGFVGSLSLSPSVSIRHSSGFGITYSPRYVTGGSSPGVYMHAVTVGVEQYDKKLFDYSFTYSHYFFTNATSVPYSPISNEIFGSLSYKKTWLKPFFSAGIGFGKDTETSPSSSVSDIGASLGISHGFSWSGGNADYSISPSFSLNAGTNEYFSLLSFTKYVGRNKQLIDFVKSSKAAAAAVRSRNRRNGTTTTSSSSSTTTSGQKFNLSNFEIAMEESVEIGSFSIRPSQSLYIPLGSAAGTGISAYWQVSLGYTF